jgi:hypothetical protein
MEIRDLPLPPSSEPLREILRLITDLTRAVEKQVEGVPGREGLLQRIRPQQEEFRTAIRTTAPCFVPKFRDPEADSAHSEEGPREMSTQSGSSEDWEPYRRLPFLEGEEDYEEIGLCDEQEIFIDDVLETAKWYAIVNISHPLPPANGDFSIQGGHARTAQQLPLHSSTRVHHRHSPSMGRPHNDVVRVYSQETKGNDVARY